MEIPLINELIFLIIVRLGSLVLSRVSPESRVSRVSPGRVL